MIRGVLYIGDRIQVTNIDKRYRLNRLFTLVNIGGEVATLMSEYNRVRVASARVSTKSAERAYLTKLSRSLKRKCQQGLRIKRSLGIQKL